MRRQNTDLLPTGCCIHVLIDRSYDLEAACACFGRWFKLGQSLSLRLVLRRVFPCPRPDLEELLLVVSGESLNNIARIVFALRSPLHHTLAVPS